MALHRGIQSAIFYYLSCAPCADARYRKKRKQEAIRDRAAREELAAELPNVYRHPSPSSTNPHWETEIALGPTGVTRGKRKTNGTSEPRGRGIKKTANGMGTNGNDSRSEMDGAHNEKAGDGWNTRPYQREDEELWGSTNNVDGMLHDTSGLHPPQRARTKDSYQAFSNPPISDLHPATVTKVSSREEVMWMLQPPPVAEIMSGKERAARRRSDSEGSRLSPTTSISLSRQVSARIIERRLRAGESSAAAMSRDSSSRASTRTQAKHGQHTTNQASHATTERDFAYDTKRRADPSEESYQTVIHHTPHDSRRHPQPHRTTSRTHLSTIASSAETPADTTSSNLDRTLTPTDLPDLVNENSAPSPPQSRDSDLAITSKPTTKPRRSKTVHLPPPPIAHRHSASILIKSGKELQFLRTEISPNRLRRREHDDGEDDGDTEEEEAILTTTLDTGAMSPSKTTAAELFDSWYTPDFELGTWVLEHTKREGVRERWSMDF